MAKHPGRGGHAWRTASATTLAPDPLICWICGNPINKDLPYPHKMSKSVDHVIPLSRTRHLPAAEQRALALDLSLLRPSHLKCNISRGASRRPRRVRKQSQEW